jgi:hypothetical protein
MPIKKKPREVPTNLPPARLYLEDVEELTEILLTAYKTLGVEPQVQYTFGTDDISNSVDALRTLGGSAKHFEIKVWAEESYRKIEVKVDGTWDPKFYCYGLPEKEQRATYQQVNDVFLGRVLTVKYLCDQIPSSVSTALWILFSIIPFNLSWIGPRFPTLGIVLTTYCGVYLLLLATYMFVPSKVLFADVRSKPKLRKELWQKNARDLGLLIAGGVITFVVELILKKYFK